MTNKITNDEPTYFGKSVVQQLETYKLFRPEAANNVEVIFFDAQGNRHENFYLSKPDGEIQGGGVYITLLISLLDKRPVTIKTDGFVGSHGERYITGVIVTNQA
ncbi:hypothetical protein Xmau_02514 [Xenorhabdus mauleonii]|uniref:Uncharacterized protein n=1 Tax=Xenorhabdus mauleonii TaxID=351675 RepID=A0A1I3RL53_9GAMM|nr:hypothetical protein [Xenorhabdus mauleonii]PHM39908.1 hypothetical protein Xmau_02514 [Xenorhabdus mauleonii]SFJ45987.1 hypothetical protein SAMN05421680_109149 [Xenorhabdus mauleonii]